MNNWLSFAPMQTADVPRTRVSRPDSRSAPLRRTAPVVESPDAEEDDDEFYEENTAPAWFAVARGAAFFVGGVTLLNLVNEIQFPQFSAAAWWVDVHPLPKPAARGFLAFTAVLLMLFSFFPTMNSALRRLAGLCTLALFGAALWNAYRYYRHAQGDIQTDFPIPFALHVAACIAVTLPGLFATSWDRFNVLKDFVFGWTTVAACVIVFPLAQFFCFGKASDRCSVDAVVMFADASAPANVPTANAESVRAAIALYRSGQARKMVLAGQSRNLSDEAVNSLRRQVTEAGIPESNVIVAVAESSESAIAEAAKTLADQKLTRALIAAPFYQLPRIKLSFQRTGLQSHSVALPQLSPLNEMRPALIREAFALWMCHLQPLLK